MLWKHWPTRELQAYLDDVSPGLLAQLENIIPPLCGETFDPTQLYRKQSLVKLMAAFAPSDCFRQKAFMRRCLDHLPPEDLFLLYAALGFNNDQSSFADKCDEIIRRGWTDPEFVRTFLDHFDLPDHFLPPQLDAVPSEEDLLAPTPESPTRIDSAYRPLKDYQFPVYARSIETLAIPRARFVIQMPTGSGKTRTAMQIVSWFLGKTRGEQLVVWLAHSEELCEQAFECFRQVWCHEAGFDVRVCRAWGDHPIPPSYDMPMVIVAGFQKLHAALRGRADRLSTLRDRVGLVVVDEAHRTMAPTYQKVVLALLGSDTKVVGLTATPGRAVSDETERLAEFYFQSMVGLGLPDTESEIEYLRSTLVLAKLTYEPLITELTYELSPAMRRHVESHFDLPRGFLEHLGGDSVRNLEIMKRLLQECRAGRSILLFSCGVEHSRFIAALLLYFGILAAHIDGETERERRRATIASFKAGEIQVLSNYGILSTGFDAPNTDVVFISRPTGSAVLYSQMIGRGLRGPEIGGTPSCKIIDVRDNIVGFGDQERLYHYFEEYWSA